MKRKRPIGSAWAEFREKWNILNHEEKCSLAAQYGVSYDMAKHWYSDFKEEPAPTDAMSVEELLASRPATCLDFVSFDIETSNLRADFSVTLTACIKPFGKEPVSFRADYYPTWQKNRDDDSLIIKDIAEELARHAIVVTHYGTGFDVPFLRAKMVKYRLPPLPPMFAVDSYSIAKVNFAVGSRRLENLANFFDLGKKSPVEGSLWMKAAYGGDTKAMDAIMEHNIQDVCLLEKLACLSFPYIKAIKRL